MCASIHIFLIALMVQSGLAIQCYQCDSDSNTSCGNKTDVNVKPEECSAEKQREFDSNDRHWLLKIYDVRYHRASKSDSPEMVCQKLMGTDDQGKSTIVRRCQLASVDCSYSDHKLLALGYSTDFVVNECAMCNDKDGCNGSPRNLISGTATVVALAVISVCSQLIL